MSLTLTDEQAKAILELAPFGRHYGADAVSTALNALIEAERQRRGDPDPVTGAIWGKALLEGTLLSREYDRDTHGHWDAWPIAAVTVDLKETIKLNMRYGFAEVDVALRAFATALKTRFPKGKVVRTQGDAFTVLLPPSAETTIDASLSEELPRLLAPAIQAALPEDGEAKPDLRFTIALLNLRISDPPNTRVLGPLVWAECERAYVLQQSGKASGVQERRLDLHGSVSATHF